MRKIISILFLLFITFSVHAQSAEVITEILDSRQASFGQVCYLSAVHQGFISEKDSYSKAIEVLYSKGQIPVKAYEGSVVPMVNLSYIFSQMWNIKGGLFFRIFNGAPRYAFKQMKADGVLPQNADPGLLVSGQDVLNIYTLCEMKYGNMQFSEE